MEMEEDKKEERTGIWNDLKTILSRLLHSKEKAVGAVVEAWDTVTDCFIPEEVPLSIEEWDSVKGDLTLVDFIYSQPIKFRECLKMGIPIQARPEVWRAMLDLDAFIEEELDYSELALRSEWIPTIDQDYHRILGSHPYFREKTNQLVLRDFLMIVAAQYKVKYLQGMGSLAAIFLLVMLTKMDAFWAYASLIVRGSPNRAPLGSLYEGGIPEFATLLARFDALVSIHMPELRKRFDEFEIKNTMYALAWFIEVYAKFPLEIVARVWDAFLYEGIDFLLRFGLALLMSQQRRLCAMECDELITSLQKYPDAFPLTMKRPGRLIRLAYTIEVDLD